MAHHSELALPPGLDTEWNSYCTELNRAGILLHNAEDHFALGRWGQFGSYHSKKNLYNHFKICLAAKYQWMAFRLWNWKLPLKIKLFNWLSVENKISTWDNLQRKGWAGPNLCQLCYKDAETVNHLFTQCTFTRHVWDRIVQVNNIKTAWTGISLTAV
jgi:hypothetical protein